MNITQLNQAISRCNPYNEKELLRHLITQRRKLENRIKQSVSDVMSGNVPAMLRHQS